MRYFFILGNNPALSAAEVSAVLDLEGKMINKNVFVLETNEEIKCTKLIKNIGGTIKIGKIAEITEENNLSYQLTEFIKNEAGDNKKIKFGISFYGDSDFNVEETANQVKNLLKSDKIDFKWINNREKQPLSSVTVEKNKLTKKGIEIVLVMTAKQKIFIGKTLAVQPFRELSFRDYHRPARDDRSGMLPPKLAQIMLNLVGCNPCNPSVSYLAKKRKNEKDNLKVPFRSSFKKKENKSNVIYDPFCGSGTILTEAILMGHRTIIGSDVSTKAIKDTQRNLKWIADKYKLGKINANIFVYDSRRINRYLKKPIIDAIITEPYLGPQRGKININQIKKELEQLYADSLLEFKKILKPAGKIVMLWPVFNINGDSLSINPQIDNFKIVNPLPENLRKDKNIKLTNRNTIIYGRPGQRVWREVVVLSQR